MLSKEEIQNNKIQFLKLLAKLNIDLTDLTKYLDSVDYFNKPATTQYFMAYPGGLCQYSLRLCFELGTLVNAYCPGKYSEEDIIKVALFKGLYRAELYEGYLKNVKNEETNNWEQVFAYRYKTERPVYGDIEFGSYMIAKRFVNFTDEQIEAIINSSAKEGSFAGDYYEIMKNYSLVALTKMADIATFYLNN